MKSRRDITGLIAVEETCWTAKKPLIREHLPVNSGLGPAGEYLWVGQDHCLNREQVAELIGRMEHWLDTGRLKVDKSD